MLLTERRDGRRASLSSNGKRRDYHAGWRGCGAFDPRHGVDPNSRPRRGSRRPVSGGSVAVSRAAYRTPRSHPAPSVGNPARIWYLRAPHHMSAERPRFCERAFGRVSQCVAPGVVRLGGRGCGVCVSARESRRRAVTAPPAQTRRQVRQKQSGGKTGFSGSLQRNISQHNFKKTTTTKNSVAVPQPQLDRPPPVF